MHRSIVLVSLLALCIAIPVWGQQMMELSELHLVSWEAVPGATPEATGPVSAAILMAWHAEHGYARLLPDLNGDGRLDREDTVKLAARFLEPMRALEGPAADPLVVEPVAWYVAERYPDAFEIWIYDPSFPDEYQWVMGRPFDPGVVPGIRLIVLDEPRHEDYVQHLERERPGIVGIGHEREPNRYAVSRSAVLAEGPRGWPVDLANTSHDPFGPNAVWETFLRWDRGHWQIEVDDLIPFETFVVLVPTREPDGEPEPDEPGFPGDEPGGDPGDPGFPGDDPRDEPKDPGPTRLPNLWVTNMTGCWSWSNDGLEHVVATVTGIVHNGGKATASNVWVSITAGKVCIQQAAGTIPAGGQKTVRATIDVGAYDTTTWPVRTSITADPNHTITEADESNNTTDSAFPQSSDCN